MLKRNIKETIYEYDTAGNVTRKTVTETVEEDDESYQPFLPPFLNPTTGEHEPWWSTVTCAGNMSDCAQGATTAISGG